MSNLAHASPSHDHVSVPRHKYASKNIYQLLSKDAPDNADRDLARKYLAQQLAATRTYAGDLPADDNVLAEWISRNTEAVGHAYREYLAERKNGAPRRYFSNKSHALYFLKSVAPSKLVDGSWLYGLLQRWDDPDFYELIRIYLEELGDGVPEKNHVVLYKKLLATHGCGQWENLSDEHFVQGAIQLSLAYDAGHFLPELIGYNLGYEQLPLHLLITAFELNELGIDPYYFTLHVTVDSAGTGHAQKALQGLQRLMPRVGDKRAFYRRVMDGYKLNDLGASTTSVITSFDLETELIGILAAKSVVGKNMHSDYCRVAGRTVNDWLSVPEQIPDFLQSLESAGWIKRGEDVENSRFWRLIQGERAEMFGVFSAYEQQVLRDWIAAPRENAFVPPRVATHRAKQRSLGILGQHSARQHRPAETRGIIRHAFPRDDLDDQEFGSDLRLLEARIAMFDNKEEAMQALTALMSPAAHHTSAGLMATRVFIRLLDR